VGRGGALTAREAKQGAGGIALIRLDGVSFHFPGFPGSEIIDALDLTIESGEWIAITGRNGSGKSILCKLIAGLLEPTAGRVTVDGLSPSGGPAAAVRAVGRRGPGGGAAGGGATTMSGPCGGFASKVGPGGRFDPGCDIPVGIAFQNPDSQFVTTSVAREVRFGMENIGLDPAETDRRFHEAVERFELGQFLGRNPHMLSGGERQRLLLAAIWSMRPRQIILDEPFSFLDSEARVRALEAVKQAFHGRTVVWATLDPEELASADRVICLEGGRIVYDGSPGEAAGAIPAGVLAEGMASSMRTEAPAAPTSGPSLSKKAGGNYYITHAGNPVVSLKEAVLSPRHGDFELSVSNLSIHAGETLGVTGPSGSGKTTLLLGCSGLAPPRKGSLTLFGERIRSRRDFPAGRVAFLFQSPEEGFFAPTVGEEISLANRNFGAGRPDEDVARDALERVGLDPDIFMNRSPFHLSQGEKRLVALAAQLALPAELFFLDEPTLFLDGRARKLFSQALDSVRTSLAAAIIGSHDLPFLSSAVDSIMELRKSGLGTFFGNDIGKSENDL
jgi:energy-coupling factor transporter ATP-binding protein EcfA2